MEILKAELFVSARLVSCKTCSSFKALMRWESILRSQTCAGGSQACKMISNCIKGEYCALWIFITVIVKKIYYYVSINLFYRNDHKLLPSIRIAPNANFVTKMFIDFATNFVTKCTNWRWHTDRCTNRYDWILLLKLTP